MGCLFLFLCLSLFGFFLSDSFVMHYRLLSRSLISALISSISSR
jgi:hypothetical protein